MEALGTKNISEINKRILNDIKENIQKSYPGIISKIVLFGSQINGNAEKYSDYDILIVLKYKYDWEMESEIIDLCYDIDLKYEIITDIKIVSLNELEQPRGKQRFIQDALHQGVFV